MDAFHKWLIIIIINFYRYIYLSRRDGKSSKEIWGMFLLLTLMVLLLRRKNIYFITIVTLGSLIARMIYKQTTVYDNVNPLTVCNSFGFFLYTTIIMFV